MLEQKSIENQKDILSKPLETPNIDEFLLFVKRKKIDFFSNTWNLEKMQSNDEKAQYIKDSIIDTLKNWKINSFNKYSELLEILNACNVNKILNDNEYKTFIELYKSIFNQIRLMTREKIKSTTDNTTQVKSANEYIKKLYSISSKIYNDKIWDIISEELSFIENNITIVENINSIIEWKWIRTKNDISKLVSRDEFDIEYKDKLTKDINEINYINWREIKIEEKNNEIILLEWNSSITIKTTSLLNSLLVNITTSEIKWAYTEYFISWDIDDFFKLVSSKSIEQIKNHVIEKYNQQKQKRENLEKFNIIDDGLNTSHVNIFLQTQYNEVLAQSLLWITYWDSILKRKYKKITINNAIFSNAVEKDIDNYIKNEIKNGKKTLSINIISHWSQNWFQIFWPWGMEILSNKDFISIFKKYPETKFIINTIACFWAWLIKQIQSEKINNILVVTQTENTIPNMIVPLDVWVIWQTKKNDLMPASTYYNLNFYHGLQTSKTYWEAINNADQKSYDNKQWNPEIFMFWDYYGKTKTKINKNTTLS